MNVTPLPRVFCARWAWNIRQTKDITTLATIVLRPCNSTVHLAGFRFTGVEHLRVIVDLVAEDEFHHLENHVHANWHDPIQLQQKLNPLDWPNRIPITFNEGHK